MWRTVCREADLPGEHGIANATSSQVVTIAQLLEQLQACASMTVSKGPAFRPINAPLHENSADIQRILQFRGCQHLGRLWRTRRMQGMFVLYRPVLQAAGKLASTAGNLLAATPRAAG